MELHDVRTVETTKKKKSGKGHKVRVAMNVTTSQP